MSPRLSLRAVLGRDYRPLEGQYKTTMLLEATPVKGLEKLPLNLLLLIDVSTSMVGEMLERVKEAASRVLDAMGDEDLAGVVTFSNRSRVAFPPRKMTAGAKDEARRALGALQVEGATNLMDGLSAAQQVVAENAGPGYNSFIVLLSDGFPTDTQGNVDREQGPYVDRARALAERSSVGLSTVGLGDAAYYDSAFLTQLAEAANGSFQYAATAAELAQRFEEEFFKIQDTVMSDVRFRFQDVPGKITRFCRAYPESRVYDPPREKDGGFEVFVGTIQQGQPQGFVADFVTGGDGREGRRLLASIQAVTGKDRSEGTATVTLEFTDDEAKLSLPRNDEVDRALDQAQLGVLQGHLAEAVAKGDQKRTKNLIETGKKLTRVLGQSRATKVLQEMGEKLDSGENISAHELTLARVESKKTRQLGK